MSKLPTFLHPFAAPARERFVRIVSGSGATVTDVDGTTYIDGMAALWYCNVGWGRHEIADAVAAQMRELAAFHCFEPFTNGPVEELADVIATLAPIDDARVFFTSSGSEAVDSAMKIARIAHARAGRGDRTLILSRGRAYHGVTYGGMTAQGLPPNQDGFGPFVGDVVNLPPDDLEAWATFLAEHGHRVAAIMTEPVQGAGGVFPPPDGLLPGLRRLADQHGAYLIFDEVITGFGRLGEWFGAIHYGVTPDLITFAKAATSGYLPLGGVAVGPTVHEPLASEAGWMLRHGHTYSGHPSACVASLANLEILRSEGLPARAPAVGARLFSGFRALEADGLVAEVRSAGAMGAIKLHDGHSPVAVRDALLARGVITRAVGTDTLTWCPPLVITDAQIDTCVDHVAAVVTESSPGA